MVTLPSFYLPSRQGLQGRDPLALDADRDWAVFGTGQYVWILQTFLRLRAAGAAVRLVEHAPRSGVVVVYADDVERLLAEALSPSELVVVAVRADRRPQPHADVEIVQNASNAGRRQVFIPHWRQPGLIPRDPARRASVEVAAFLGHREQLHPDLASPGWESALSARGVRWDARVKDFTANDRLYDELPWNDYTDIDVVVALRPASLWHSRAKPAAKLQNGWAAGVPVIASPEVAYRELRESSLDYIEAESGAEALAAVDVLRGDPELYAAMVSNGFERARPFSPDRVTERWADALWREIPMKTGGRGRRLLRRVRRSALVRRARRTSSRHG